MKEKIKEPSPKSSNGHQIASRFMPANPALNLEGSKLPVNLAATAVATSSKSVVDRRILPMRLSSLLTLGKTGESRDWKIVFIFIDVVCFCFRLPQFLLVSSEEWSTHDRSTRAHIKNMEEKNKDQNEIIQPFTEIETEEIKDENLKLGMNFTAKELLDFIIKREELY